MHTARSPREEPREAPALRRLGDAERPLLGAVEAGGTKFVCALGTGPDDLRAEVRFPTTRPGETLRRALEFFRRETGERGRPRAVGIGSFGPADVARSSPGFGHITSTPKPGWANTDVVGAFEELGVPVGFDTDVNAAALGEAAWGAGTGLDTFVYVTVGTGIGGGAVVEGELLHGHRHPEMGHVRVPRERERDPFPGSCPFHGDCLEGLASGPALEARWGRPAHELPIGHPAWDLEAEYLAHAVTGWTLTLAPQRVILGGGVMERAFLFPAIRRRVVELLGGYLDVPELRDRASGFIVPPGLGSRAGLMGAFRLAHRALKRL